MKLRNGILDVGGTRLETGLIGGGKAGQAHMIDVLEAIMIIARGVHAKLWSKKETRELLETAYRDLRNQENLYSLLLWDLSRRAEDLAPYWWMNLETLDHDLDPEEEDDTPPWGDEEDDDAPSTGGDCHISGLLVAPRKASIFNSISRHILGQEEGTWYESDCPLDGIYVDNFDRCLVVGVAHRESSEFAWWESQFGSLDEAELDALYEFLSLLLSISRRWGPLQFLAQDEVDTMSTISWKYMAPQWREGPIGALVEDYLRKGPIWRAAMRVARIPHI